MNKIARCALAAVSAIAHQIGAQEPKTPAFDGPRVMKLGWDTANLVSSDFDRDGRGDLALLNNGNARIELLYSLAPGKTPPPSSRPISDTRWEPVLDDAPFQKASIVTGHTMHALAAGDFNQDNLPDLAYTNDQGKLVLRYQAEDQAWNEKKEIEIGDTLPYGSTLLSTDVNGDGKIDLLVLTKKNLHLLLQGNRGSFDQTRLPLADSQTSGLRFADVDGDKRPDIFYLASVRADNVTIRRQLPDGSFSREELFEMGGSPRSFVEPIRYPAGSDADNSVVYIQNDTGLVEVSRLKSKEDPSGLGVDLPLQRYAIPNSTARFTSFALGNFLGASEMPDVAVTDGEGAQLWILESKGGDSYAPPLAFPSYAGVNDVSAIEFDGEPSTSELLVVSQREKALGVMSRQAPGQPLRYPTSLPSRGTPLAATVIPGKPHPSIACIIDDNGKRELLLLERKEANYAITQSRSLPEISSKPRAIRAFDINQDERTDLLIFSPDEPMRVLLRMEDGTFSSFNDPQGLPGNLIDKLDASAVSFADFDGDGKQELLIARKRLARALRLKDGKVEVIAQFNAEAENADLTFAILLPGPEAKKRALLAYDAARAQLVRAERDETDVFREKATFETRLKTGSSPALSPASDKLIIVSPTDIHVTKIGDTTTALAAVASYETDLERTEPAALRVGQLGGSTPFVILLDTTKTRVLELLRLPEQNSKDKRWKSVMHFAVFNQDPHYRGKTGASQEPHDLLLADVTQDGQADLILLAHDRLLVYTSR